jgi:allophanate hydrolase subunit 1
VAIADSMSGIYPADLPGGWWIIGHTDLAMFDPHRDPPALLAPGDRVRFERVGS